MKINNLNMVNLYVLKCILGVLLLCGVLVSCKSDSGQSRESMLANKEIQLEERNDSKLPCEEIPVSFSSFSEAERIVRNAKYQFIDKVDNLDSEWITSAEYYSCDGSKGYFIMCTVKSGCYIFDDVEMEIWEGFKGAGDYGKYYHKAIKGKYRMYDRRQ